MSRSSMRLPVHLASFTHLTYYVELLIHLGNLMNNSELSCACLVTSNKNYTYDSNIEPCSYKQQFVRNEDNTEKERL